VSTTNIIKGQLGVEIDLLLVVGSLSSTSFVLGVRNIICK
jgi:hypothetical protein